MSIKSKVLGKACSDGVKKVSGRVISLRAKDNIDPKRKKILKELVEKSAAELSAILKAIPPKGITTTEQMEEFCGKTEEIVSGLKHELSSLIKEGFPPSMINLVRDEVREALIAGRVELEPLKGALVSGGGKEVVPKHFLEEEGDIEARVVYIEDVLVKFFNEWGERYHSKLKDLGLLGDDGETCGKLELEWREGQLALLIKEWSNNVKVRVGALYKNSKKQNVGFEQVQKVLVRWVVDIGKAISVQRSYGKLKIILELFEDMLYQLLEKIEAMDEATFVEFGASGGEKELLDRGFVEKFFLKRKTERGEGDENQWSIEDFSKGERNKILEGWEKERSFEGDLLSDRRRESFAKYLNTCFHGGLSYRTAEEVKFAIQALKDEVSIDEEGEGEQSVEIVEQQVEEVEVADAGEVIEEVDCVDAVSSKLKKFDFLLERLTELEREVEELNRNFAEAKKKLELLKYEEGELFEEIEKLEQERKDLTAKLGAIYESVRENGGGLPPKAEIDEIYEKDALIEGFLKIKGELVEHFEQGREVFEKELEEWNEALVKANFQKEALSNIRAQREAFVLKIMEVVEGAIL